MTNALSYVRCYEGRSLLEGVMDILTLMDMELMPKKCNVLVDLRLCLSMETLHIFKDQGSKGKVNSSAFALNVDGTMKKEK
jgi:hypothetical protein